MTNLTFRHVPAVDISVDAAYDLLADGKKTGISVQDCRDYGAGYTVNEIGNEDTDDIWLLDLGSFRTLKAAQAHAIKHFNGRVAAVAHFKVA